MPTPNTPWEEDVTAAMRACTEVFGEGAGNVTYTHLGGEAYTLNGIWDADSIRVDPDTGVQIISNQPMISFALADMQAQPDNNDLLTARGVNYRVREPEFDGQGTVTLMLYRV
jgi:hypothetical protein